MKYVFNLLIFIFYSFFSISVFADWKEDHLKKAISLNQEERINLGRSGRYFYQNNFSSKIRRKQLTEYFEK